MTKSILPFIIILLSAWLNNAFACDCAGEATVKEAVASSDFVVYGQIISSQMITNNDTIELKDQDRELYHVRGMRYTVLIMTSYKAEFRTDTLIVYSGSGSADCGVLLETGQKYIIYACWSRPGSHQPPKNHQAETLYTGLCTRTTGNIEKEMAALKEAGY